MAAKTAEPSRGALDFPLPARRTLVGWVVVDRVLREWPEPDWGREHNECYGHLERWLVEECSREHTRRGDRSSVLDFLKKLATRLSVEAADLAEGRDTAVGEALAGLAQQVERVAARFRDDPVAGLVDWVRRATVACYREVRPDIETRLTGVRTRIGLAAGDPDRSLGRWRVSGSAQPAEGLVAVVELAVASRLDRATWGAVPYVLLHEYLSHVAQGPWTADCRRPAETDMFAEGWMDVVTFGLHQMLVDGLGGVEPLSESPSLQAEAAGLYALRRTQRPTLSHTRALGYETAEEFRRLVGHERFFRLSLAVNASSAPHARRHAFVWGIKKALGESDGTRQLRRWIADYDMDQDVDRILTRVLQYYTDQ